MTDIFNNIKQIADENGYELTEYAEKIAKAKERFFGEKEWQRCPCDPNSDRACISNRCKEEIAKNGHCHCNCYKLKELKIGWYYIKLWKGCNVIDYFIGNQFLRYDDSDIVEVIAPVPTFDEWQASEKYNKHLEEKIKIYEQKDKQATETSIAYNELANENTILKELLKDCRLAIFDYPPFDLASDKIKLTNKIDEILK